MKAIMRHTYCSPEEMTVGEIPRPTPGPGEVLVELRAVGLNGSDQEYLTGFPFYARVMGLRKPRTKVLGSDIAGVVVERGQGASLFQLGDEVFGDIMYIFGGLAEYVCVPEQMLFLKPDFLSFEEAAALPQGGVIALQGVRDLGQVRPGQKVLINGGGGSAGSFAIQIAKILGAEVTGVDIQAKQGVMRSAGADHVIDYREVDYTLAGERYDFIFDLFLTRSVFEVRRALLPGGRYAMVGGTVPRLLQVVMFGFIASIFGSKRFGLLVAEQNKREDLETLMAWIAEKKLRPFIARSYALLDAPRAFRAMLDGQIGGKAVIVRVPSGA